MTIRIWKLSLPFIVAGLVPVAAFADNQDDITTGTQVSNDAQEDCVNKCLQEASASQTAPKSKAKTAKKASSKKTSTVAQDDTGVFPNMGADSESKGTGVYGNLGATTLYPDQATLDGIRSEERARAAEEFSTDQQQSHQAHQSEIERARLESKSQAESEASQALSAERQRYEQALADERSKSEKIGDALITPAGVYGFIGGGATNFTQPEANGATEAGGYWDARVGVGTRSILGGEIAYTGSARDIQALGVGEEAFLLSNGIEGVARLNVPITPGEGKVLIEPYTFGGIGWNRYNVVSDASLSADFTNEDDIMTVPLGLGMAFGVNGVTLDTRATYRQAIGSDLLGSETSSFGESSLNSWAAGAALGFEF